jgi:hypothetical protein
MPQLPSVQLHELDVSYPAVVLDSAYGTQVQVSLNRTQLVKSYNLIVVLGSLSGGTSPAWTVSGSNPIISHVNISADNNVFFDGDYQIVANEEAWMTNDTPDGKHLRVRMCDTDLRSGEDLLITGFPSFSYNQVILTVTIPALSALTSGSPTGTSGTTLYITETSAPRSQVNFKPLVVKRLMVAQTMPLSGQNDLVTILSQDGSYSRIFAYCDTGASGYSAPSDSAIQRLKIIVNSLTTVRDSYWQVLKAQGQATTGFSLATGYAPIIFKPQKEASQLFNIKDTRAITSVDLQALTTVANARLVILKTEYL